MPRIAIFEGYGAQGPPDAGQAAMMFGVAVLLAVTLLGKKRVQRKRRKAHKKRRHARRRR